MNLQNKINVGIFFGNYGPYHHARVGALQSYTKNLNFKIIPIEISKSSSTYSWESKFDNCKNLKTLFHKDEEKINPILIFFKTYIFLRKNKIKVIFLPSYSPLRYFVLFLAAKANLSKTIMMNESHRGTEKAKGIKKIFKIFIINQFDSALVGGKPHKRYFNSLGFKNNKIFTGYDAINNKYFTEASRAIKDKSNNKFRDKEKEYQLPSKYFLSLGRLVKKKNLKLLIIAYFKYTQFYLDKNQKIPSSLVFVGDGEDKEELVNLVRELGLNCYDFSQNFNKITSTNKSIKKGSVYFYGFKQIDENPIFYTKAKAFVLPSLYEEWGLVINEAMACSIPVLVSKVVGCVEDLMPKKSKFYKINKINFYKFLSLFSFERLSNEDLPELRDNGLIFNPLSDKSLSIALRYMEEGDNKRYNFFAKKMGLESKKIIRYFSCSNFAKQAHKALRCVI